MTNALTLTLAQLNPTVGDIDGNLAKIREVWQSADSDLVILPELFLCGYPPEDLIFKPIFLDTIDRAVEALVKESARIPSALLLSVPMRKDYKTYSALHLIENGTIKHTQFKHDLPNYGVFDEQRIFEPGPLPEPVDFRGHKLGILICADAWIESVTGHIKNKGAEILIVPNGSPFSIINARERMDVMKMRVEQTGLPMIYVNQVGGQDELVFDGTSFVMDVDGTILYQAPSFEEAVDTFSCHPYQAQRVEGSGSKKRSLDFARDDSALIYNAIVCGLRDYVTKNGFPGVVLGLSGGIDSALTTAFCVDALSADNVHCIMMPTRFTSQDSLDDAKDCADNLGCRYDILPIDDTLKAFEDAIPNLAGIAHENIQSRIRGTTLMALSNSSGDMVVSTGNKSEMAVGYATLYGDMNGGFNPLKDLYKTQVYKLAKWRNEQNPVIPERILTKAPTAELKDNQTDQDSLPPYETLDDILECLIEEEMGVEKIEARGHDRATILKVWTLLDRAEYKRRQACPGVKITGKAFGRDRRYPITNKFFGNIEKS